MLRKFGKHYSVQYVCRCDSCESSGKHADILNTCEPVTLFSSDIISQDCQHYYSNSWKCNNGARDVLWIQSHLTHCWFTKNFWLGSHAGVISICACVDISTSWESHGLMVCTVHCNRITFRRLLIETRLRALTNISSNQLHLGCHHVGF